MTVINATLIVQAVHFFIAYIILRTLFFAPAIRELEVEKGEQLHLEDTIEEVKVSLERKQAIRDAQWREVQQFYSQNSPQISDGDLYFFRDISPELEAPRIPENARDALVIQASSALTDKIKKTYHV
jgi:hypothetical protein